MHPFHALLAVFAVAAFLALVLLMRWERRRFLRMGKGGAWLPVRLATIPIALATAALIVVPARSTSGMEGLAVAYALLLAVAPVFWFGAHWLVGRLVRPPLSFGESAQIAGSPLALAIALSWAAHALQPVAWQVLRSVGKA
jgi:hypothetical protein